MFGALADKDVGGIVAPLSLRIDHWHLAGLDALTSRGLRVIAICAMATFSAAAPQAAAIVTHANPREALAAAQRHAGEGDRIVAFGSFYVAAAALGWADAYWQA